MVSSVASAESPIELVLPSPPGGATDIVARVVAQHMSDNGIPMVVVNKPGGQHIIAANYVAESKPDGKTLFLGSTSSVILLTAFKEQNLKFDNDSWSPVAFLATAPLVVVAKKDFPADNLNQLFQQIKKDPGIPAGSWGKLGDIQLSVLFSHAGNFNPSIVRYAGDNAIINDLIGSSQLSLAITSYPPAKKFADENKIKILGSLSGKLNDAPGISTTQDEFGWSSFAWYGVLAPKGTPKDVVEKLHAAFNRALKDPVVIEKLTSVNFDIKSMSIGEFEQFLTNQHVMYRPVVKKLLENSKK